MKRNFYLLILLTTAIILNSCQKTTVQTSFDSVFTEPYTTGIIKFQYKVQARVEKGIELVDTTVLFTSDQEDNYIPYGFGYWDPSVPWFQVMRLNRPNDFDHRAGIFIQSTDFDKLTLPYTFKAGDYHMAQFNYMVGGFKTLYDSQGNPMYQAKGYSAITFYDNFKLTILSKTNNRVQGTFSGIATNEDSATINISQGLFDVEIVNK